METFFHPHPAVVQAALFLLAACLPVAAAAAPLPLPTNPCSAAGWQLVRQVELPRFTVDRRRIGGFSALRTTAGDGRLWLLSDLPRGTLTLWRGLGGQGPLQLERLVELGPGPGGNPGELDGEGLVMGEGQAWVASEGRRSRERPAQLLRFDSDRGALLQAVPLPADWQPAPGQGLASNGGPESLMALPLPGGAPALLMAAETPLLQDPPDRVRLLRWRWAPGHDPRSEAPRPEHQGSLALPEGEGWGLTDLLPAGPDRLLALMRRFTPPTTWEIRLELHALPGHDAVKPAPALASWDLISAGLVPDNWEALAEGPPLPDGRSSLVVVSDDNLSPLQASRLALLTADRPGCRVRP
ncbi:esterase-like activity of phytase family protein [Cyanobium sp. FGCU-6]|jgi:hypothetical protein|nr:esterase-like activity of phytase family protein [Cyanobium sp. FGCU6]